MKRENACVSTQQRKGPREKIKDVDVTTLHAETFDLIQAFTRSLDCGYTQYPGMDKHYKRL